MYARPAFLSHDARERIIEESTHKFCDYIRLNGIDRSHEDAFSREKNDEQCQGVVYKADALTDELSTAMTKTVADQNDRANVIAKKRIGDDMLFACRFVETVADKFNPYVRRLPAGERINNGLAEKPYEIYRKDVPQNRIIIEYPKSTQKFYIIDCPICEKSYEMLKDLYYHIMSGHSGIIVGEKSYAHALEIGGTRIKDAERRWVKDHNEMYRMQKNALYVRCKKRFQQLHKDDNKGITTPDNAVATAGEASTTEGSADDGNSNNAVVANDTAPSNLAAENIVTDEANGEPNTVEEANADGIAYDSDDVNTVEGDTTDTEMID